MYLLNSNIIGVLSAAFASQKDDLIEAVLTTAGIPFKKDGPVAFEESYMTTGKTAVIHIVGVLGNGRYRMTTYENIKEGVLRANSDPNIENIELQINSPGGDVAGFYPAAVAIKESKKEVTSMVTGMAASAAYMLASQSKKITAIDPLIPVGSVGVAQEVWNDKGYWTAMGFDVETFVNDESLDKRPDITTDRGKAVYKRGVNDIYYVLEKMIADGRGITVEELRENFGEGAMFIAAEAIKRGMINAIQGEESDNTTKEKAETSKSNSTIKEEEVEEMAITTVEEMQSKYPEFCKQVSAQAVASEKERVSAWVKVSDLDLDAAKVGIASSDALSAEDAVDMALKSKGKSSLKDEASDNADDVQTPDGEGTPDDQGYSAIAAEIAKLNPKK